MLYFTNVCELQLLLLFQGTTYELTQFHFHWGADSSKGSEHTINGKYYQMEVKMYLH